MTILTIRLWAAPPLSAGPPLPLPPAILTTLNQEYPGWKLAPVSPQIQSEFKKHKINRLPSLTSGDFDHDGKRDYVVQIVFTAPDQGEQPVTEQIVIVYLWRENAYEETIVQSMGLDPTVYLWVANKPMTETGSNAQDILTNKDVLMVLGGPAGDTTYVYEDGRFQEMKTEEDPEHPDPSIPRPPIPL
jgi:hypothetical protein